LKPPGSVGNPVKAGRDVDSPGRSEAIPVSDAVVESDDKAGNEAEVPDDAAELAAPEDAVGIATLPVLDRVGRFD
jgi:hypothetical protein